MDDHAPVTLKLGISAFYAIAAAVTEAEIGGEVSSVKISELKPDVQLMLHAVAVEVTVSSGSGRATPRTWIVAGDGSVVAHLGPPTEGEDEDEG